MTDEIAELLRRLRLSVTGYEPTDELAVEAVYALKRLALELDNAEAKLAALNLCEPHFLDRKLRELDEWRKRAEAAEAKLNGLPSK